MGKGKIQRRKGKKASPKNMPGVSLKNHLMARSFNAAATRQTMKVQGKYGRLVNERTDINSQAWANSIRPQKTECLLMDLPPEVRLRIWEFCIRNLPCGRRPVTIARSERQFKRDQHLIERKHYSGQVYAALKRAKFFDSVHPNFRAQMFNLLMICRQACLEIVGGALLYKLKAFRFTHRTIMAQFCIRIEPLWNFIRSLVLDFEIFSSSRLSHVLGVRGFKKFPNP